LQEYSFAGLRRLRIAIALAISARSRRDLPYFAEGYFIRTYSRRFSLPE
jgi:hypothetical protein